MELSMWVLVAAMAGGFLAGLVALTVGGVGVLLTLRRTTAHLAEAIDHVDAKVERQLKKGAAFQRTPDAAVVEALAARIPRDDHRPLTREDVVRLGRERGLVR